MDSTPIYWIDSNVLITAKDGPFRFALAPAFWVALDSQASAGNIKAPKLVYEEIVRNAPDDELAKWLRSRRGNGFCISPEKTVQKAYGLVVDHVQNNYRSHHAAKFLSVADPWIIAHALDSKGVVVTFEKKQPGANCVKIPNVCGSLGVPFMNLYDMLVALGITFA